MEGEGRLCLSKMEEKELFSLIKKGKRKQLVKKFGTIATDDLPQLLNKRDNEGKTALHLATKAGNTKCIRMLLENGANPNLQDIDGRTPLHTACRKTKIVDLFYLIEHGGSIHTKDKDGVTPLDLALKKNHQSVIDSVVGEDTYESPSATRLTLRLGASEESITDAEALKSPRTIVQSKTSLRFVENGQNTAKQNVEKNQLPKAFKDIPVAPMNILPSELQSSETACCRGHWSKFVNAQFGSLDVLVKSYIEDVPKDDQLQLFVNEVRAICNLRHPRVPTLLGIIFEPLNMDYRQIYEAPSRMFLHRCLFDNKDPITEEDVLHLAMDVADALQFIHARKYMHCSIAAWCITVDYNWRAKLGNFEYSQSQGNASPISHYDHLYHYMAPEQLKGCPAHPSNDVYGLGNVVWECIVRTPIKDTIPQNMIFDYGQSRNFKLKHFPKQWGNALKTLVEDCLEKQKKRPKACQVFDWIDGLLKSNLISAKPSTMTSSEELTPVQDMYDEEFKGW